MPIKGILVVVGSLILFAGACGGTGGAERGADSVLVVPQGMDDLGTNEARILATVTAIYGQRSANGPCARAACEATIRIDSVMGYGSAFPRPLAKGELLDARFAFTLGSTEDVDLNIDRTYPGLNAGESFWADLQGRAVPGGPSFVVYGYYPAHE